MYDTSHALAFHRVSPVFALSAGTLGRSNLIFYRNAAAALVLRGQPQGTGGRPPAHRPSITVLASLASSSWTACYRALSAPGSLP